MPETITDKPIFETTKWIETTLRKGTKSPKICRDMFVSEYRGEFKLVVVKNGRMFSKTTITPSEASRFQRLHDLKCTNGVFSGGCSYRTKASTELIKNCLIK